MVVKMLKRRLKVNKNMDYLFLSHPDVQKGLEKLGFSTGK